ncbi:MAG TPA: maleylpyruvate isomerase family mycothiol-dependent enzyme [Chloroflexota bacterium]|jgi:uncharacterized protein (TIGR03083 family)
MTTTFDTIRHIEHREIDRLDAYLAPLDADGWLEQSYCTEWRVYQVASHLASGARIFLGNLAQWFDDGPPMAGEDMRRIWAEFDAMAPGEIYVAFHQATQDYFARLEALPPEAGTMEVDGFLGRKPARTMLALRLNEVVLHTWDVLVARDRAARLPADALETLLTTQLELRTLRMPAPLAGKRILLTVSGSQWQWLIDCRGEKPVVESPTGEAEIRVDAPAEELCRLLSGRHFLPGSLPLLTWQGGSYQEIAALNIFAW